MPAAATTTGTLPPPPNAGSLLDHVTLEKAARRPERLLQALKPALARLDNNLVTAFDEGIEVTSLIRARAWGVEQLLIAAWEGMIPAAERPALVAVGGFGRGELHPGSDIDLMILLDRDTLPEALKSGIERFFTLLWDVGLNLGHSVRTVAQCEDEARKDVVTATNLMEARLLRGDRDLFDRMMERTGSEQIWPVADFFQAKYREQQERHQRFGDTAYNLEPNIKEGPGGLRDIQMISWVCKRYFGEASLHKLVDNGFLTEAEFTDLKAGREFLWRVRFALHLLAGRAEDRLLFDYQQQVAARLGFGEAGSSNEAVETFMQRYYRQVMRLERLNDSLLQLFREELIHDQGHAVEQLGEDFTLQNGYLGLRDTSLFSRNPVALVEMFVLLAKRPDIRGVRASAIRQTRHFLRELDRPLGDIPGVLAAFLKLLCQPEGVYTQLQRMNRYGVLASLMPDFAAITGRMQFDLFHVFTVDQHILFVVRNLRRFAYGKYAGTYPGMAEVFREIQKPELLYLAALFHDIAKGRGGDHSELGAQDALTFCGRLGIDPGDAELVAWLVEHHLLMSKTAQRADISDPAVVAGFAEAMGSLWRLRYLYLLSVADISATSPKLWNAWKAGLLRDLYRSSSAVLSGAGDHDTDYESRLAAARDAVRSSLLEEGLPEGQIDKVLPDLPEAVFLRISTRQLAWAALMVADVKEQDPPLIATRRRSDLGVSEVLVNAPDYTGLFASTTTVFDEMGLNVLSARVFTGANRRSFDIFQVMNAQGLALPGQDCELLEERLESVLAEKQLLPPVRRALPRRLRPFQVAPEVNWGTARSGTVTTLEISCTDQPGLLSQLASIMVACEIRIHDAMIATLGDRVEDTFQVTDTGNQILGEEHKTRFEKALDLWWKQAD